MLAVSGDLNILAVLWDYRLLSDKDGQTRQKEQQEEW